MAQFEAFAKGVEVNGQTVLAVVNALPIGREFRKEILAFHGIVDPQPGEWYSQQSWLDGFKNIAEELGNNTLYSIGKAIPNNASFPPEINNLEKALESIDLAYHMNHRGGEIGQYRLVSFDESHKKAIMLCHNPYPSEFDRGIITSMLKNFKPKSSINANVALDKTKDSRLQGADSCTYIITW